LMDSNPNEEEKKEVIPYLDNKEFFKHEEAIKLAFDLRVPEEYKMDPIVQAGAEFENYLKKDGKYNLADNDEENLVEFLNTAKAD